jgi:orotidine-5'-phosphate decarboxylase
MLPNRNPKDYICVALDVSSLDELKRIIELLADHVGCYKLGLESLMAIGAPLAIETAGSYDVDVFADIKANDIATTVGKAVKATVSHGANIVNVHASCGRVAMAAAVANRGNSLILAVTVLTSFDDEACEQVFVTKPTETAIRLAMLARSAGVDGLICSPKELALFSGDRNYDGLLLVTPGVRPAWAAANDQKRIMTPGDAVRAGADMLVIGRPILQPPSGMTPLDAAKRIADEIEKAQRERNGG